MRGDLPPAPGRFKSVLTRKGRTKVWYLKRDAEHREQAIALLRATERRIWPELTRIMKRAPLSDKNLRRNGRDGRLDIYFVPLSRLTDGEAIPYPAPCGQPSPVFLRLDNGLLEEDQVNDALSALTHELMHAIQYSYPLARGCLASRPYEWWSEATATWAEDFVYPDSQTEHQYAEHILEQPHVPLESTAGTHAYGAYLFPLYLDRVLAAPRLVRESWEEIASGKTALAAVNAVVPGGFAKTWPQFARYNWNRGPVAEYRRLDSLGIFAVPAIDRTFALRSSSSEVQRIGTRVRHLAASYSRFRFVGSKARSVSFVNGLAGAGRPAKVQALIKVEDRPWTIEDWTNARVKTFCRDRQAERLSLLVLIISNSEWRKRNHVLQAPRETRLRVTNTPCQEWTGSIRGTHRFESRALNFTERTVAEVTFTYRGPWWNPIGQPAGVSMELPLARFAADRVSVKWKHTGKLWRGGTSFCRAAASGSFTGAGSVIVDVYGAGRQQYRGSGLAFEDAPVAYRCANGTSVDVDETAGWWRWPLGVSKFPRNRWFLTDWEHYGVGEPQFVSGEGGRMAGTTAFVYHYDSELGEDWTITSTWSWDLAAIGLVAGE
jgi:hypothetical protein